MITEPMLAGTVKDISKLRYPLIATPKLDGIRALKVDGKLVSRKFKPIPNHYVRETLEKILPNGIDGEIMIPGKGFNDIQSAIMSRDGEPEFEFWAFDLVQNTPEMFLHYNKRTGKLRYWITEQKESVRRFVKFVPTQFIEDARKLDAFEQNCLSDGYEGVMLRAPDSPYKCGRSTFKEHYLLKLKRFEDSEAKVIGFVELMHNENEKEQDAFGRTKRSHKKGGKTSSGLLGAFKVRDIKHSWEFEIGTGFTAEQRKDYWDNPRLLGEVLTYKYQPHGMKDVPRAPVFKGWRRD